MIKWDFKINIPVTRWFVDRFNNFFTGLSYSSGALLGIWIYIEYIK